VPRHAQWPPPIHQHKSGQARVRIRGHDHYLGPYGSLEARKNYALLLAQVTSSPSATPTSPEPTPPSPATPLAKPALEAQRTVADLAVLWLEQRAPQYSNRGGEVAQFRRMFAALLAVHGETLAREFGSDELEEVQLAMASGSWLTAEQRADRAKHKTPTDWCARVVNRHITRLRTFWRWCERKKLAPAGSWAALRTVEPLAGNDPRVRHTSRRKPCTFADLLQVVRHAPRVVKAMLLLQWWCGMRPGEVRRMRACEIDRTSDVWIYRPSQHKNDWRGQERVVPLGPKAQAVLGSWLARATAPEAYLFPPTKRRKGSEGCYTSAGYCRAVQVAGERAGVKGLHAYLCRHAAKQRVTRELGLDAARSFLGQKSVQSTDGYGDAVDLQQAREAARRMG
jgi:integrase